MEGIELTRDMLLRNGWEEHGNIMVLKASVRFGWYPATRKLIAGYTDVPLNPTLNTGSAIVMEKATSKYCKKLRIPSEAIVDLHWIH